jgi:hypothetical protein
MKKIIIFLFSVILTMNCANAQTPSDFCEITIFMWHTEGIGWYNNSGIEITVDGVNYGTVKLPYGFDIYEGEETVLIPSGEVHFSWKGQFEGSFQGFEIYNTLGELIYTSPTHLPAGVFFIYQNECPFYVECLPITDLEGVYNQEERQVNLTWIAPESDDLTGFDIYRNDSLIDHLSSTTIFYIDYTAELENGNYTYCVIPLYPYECDLEDECREIPIYVGIKNYASTIDIYPNPADNIVNISGISVANVKVFNNMGQLISTQHHTNAINISALTNGMYILYIETLTGNTIQKKLTINH